MKRNWEIEALIEHCTLSPAEIELIQYFNRKDKEDYTRLGLACLMKYLQYNGCFPEHKNDVPRPVVNFLAEQLKLLPDLYLRYNWQSRTLIRHRALLRQALGYRVINQVLAEDLREWLFGEVQGFDQSVAELKTDLLSRRRSFSGIMSVQRGKPVLKTTIDN